MDVCFEPSSECSNKWSFANAPRESIPGEWSIKCKVVTKLFTELMVMTLGTSRDF